MSERGWFPALNSNPEVQHEKYARGNLHLLAVKRPSRLLQVLSLSLGISLYFKFPGTADLGAWARDYRLEVTATDDGALVSGISGYVCQHRPSVLLDHSSIQRRGTILISRDNHQTPRE